MPRPVYWKPRYPTRSMRERAWAKRARAREAALKQTRRPSLLQWFRQRFLGNT